MGTLHEDICKFVILLLIIPRMRNICDKSCKEYQNTCWVFTHLLLKIVPYMRWRGKMC